ncbi:MAG: CHRD domain-containing protein, partial [Ferruginibacter sp.]
MKLFCTSILLFIMVNAGFSQNRYLYAVLEGTQEVPANASTATGVVIVKYNSSTRLLELWGDYDGLAAAATASHIHSPAAAGINAGVLFPINITGGTTGTLTLNATLTPTQETDLLAANMYVNVHNATFPGGEIRGQLLESTNAQTVFFSGRLQGAQEVPPNPGTATGYVRTLLDKSLNKVYTTGSFTGL